MFLKDFGPTLHYIKGTDNVLADAMSCLLFAERQDPINTAPFGTPQHLVSSSLDDPNDDFEPLNAFYSMATDDADLQYVIALSTFCLWKTYLLYLTTEA